MYFFWAFEMANGVHRRDRRGLAALLLTTLWKDSNDEAPLTA